MEQTPKKPRTKEMVVVAMLAALVTILAALAVTTNAFKVTFESLPVHLAAQIMGPMVGGGVGLVGTFLYQMLLYGFTITTPLWILPYGVCGFISGIYSKKHSYSLTVSQSLIITIVCELIITLMNTFAIYVDSKVFGYYYPALIVGNLALRLGICLSKGIAFGLILPPIVGRVKKNI